MSAQDAATGAITLVGNHNWKRAPLALRAVVLLFGRYERFDHLGKRMSVFWWRGQPYLALIREA